MKLPRWTVYPALAVIALFAVTAVPSRGSRPHHEGAALRARSVAEAKAATDLQSEAADDESPEADLNHGE